MVVLAQQNSANGKKLKWDTKSYVEAGQNFIRGSKMWNGTICAPTPWGGKPGGAAYGSQSEEWKASGLDCFRMLHTSKVKQFSNMFSSFCIMSKDLPLCSLLFQTFSFAPIAHFHSGTSLATRTSFFWALGLLLGSLHKARDEEGCLPSLSSGLPNNY